MYMSVVENILYIYGHFILKTESSGGSVSQSLIFPSPPFIFMISSIFELEQLKSKIGLFYLIPIRPYHISFMKTFFLNENFRSKIV